MHKVAFVTNKHNLSTEFRLYACISYRITIVIHITVDNQGNYNCFNAPFANAHLHTYSKTLVVSLNNI